METDSAMEDSVTVVLAPLDFTGRLVWALGLVAFRISLVWDSALDWGTVVMGMASMATTTTATVATAMGWLFQLLFFLPASLRVPAD